MPILVLAVIAFLVFNVLMAMMILALIGERRYQRDHADEYPKEEIFTPPDVDPSQLVFDSKHGDQPRWRVAG